MSELRGRGFRSPNVGHAESWDSFAAPSDMCRLKILIIRSSGHEF